MDLEGSIVPMVTPTTRDGDVKKEVLTEFTNHLVDGGSHSLMPLGTTGEFSSFPPEKRNTVVETVSEAADVPVIAGCGGTGVDSVSQYIADASDVGADVAAVVTPYYLSTPEEGLREFYETIADDAPIPILLYHIPQVTGQECSPELIVELAEHDNIVGIKDSSGNFRNIHNILTSTPSSFDVLPGITELAPLALCAGSSGMVSSLGNVFPEIMSEVFESHKEGDHERSLRLTTEIAAPLATAYDSIPTAAATKYLVKLRGYDVGEPVLPLPSLSAPQRDVLERDFEAAIDAVDQLPR